WTRLHPTSTLFPYTTLFRSTATSTRRDLQAASFALIYAPMRAQPVAQFVAAGGLRVIVMLDTNQSPSTAMSDMAECWPSLPLAAWKDTYATLHMWTQIVGKVRLALTPRLNHWWNVPLYVSARGLTTT